MQLAFNIGHCTLPLPCRLCRTLLRQHLALHQRLHQHQMIMTMQDEIAILLDIGVVMRNNQNLTSKYLARDRSLTPMASCITWMNSVTFTNLANQLEALVHAATAHVQLHAAEPSANRCLQWQSRKRRYQQCYLSPAGKHRTATKHRLGLLFSRHRHRQPLLAQHDGAHRSCT